MIRRTLITLTALLFIFTAGSFAAGKAAAARTATVVDQGSLGIFQNGQRLATETFTIRQYPDSNVTSSDLRSETGQGTGKVEQTSELTLLPDGTISRYEWKQMAPTRSSAIVEPSDQVLTMHVVQDGKSSDQNFFLTATAFILDDYFFSTREVLLWRYLATAACKPRSSGDGCDLTRERFAILIPRRRTSSEVFVEFKGYDDTPLNGRPQRLRHFLLQTDGPDWHLWLDSNHKLVRISIPDTNTEILRQENGDTPTRK
jgi:hypothetical protein